MYGDGRGVLRDYAEAAKWTRKAAEQGYAFAEMSLAAMYVEGRGVEKGARTGRAAFEAFVAVRASCAKPTAAAGRCRTLTQSRPKYAACAPLFVSARRSGRTYRLSSLDASHGKITDGLLALLSRPFLRWQDSFKPNG